MGVPAPRSRKRKRKERPDLKGFLAHDEEFGSAASADDYEFDDDSSALFVCSDWIVSDVAPVDSERGSESSVHSDEESEGRGFQ